MGLGSSVVFMLRPEEVNLVIAHGHCPDGFGAAWAVSLTHGRSIEYHFAHYGGEKIDRDEIPDVTGKNVLMVDFAYPDIGIMNELNAKANKMLLLDHHKSAKEKLEGKIDCDHIFDMDRSGARMAWDFMHPQKEVSLLIRYIEDRDIWKWEMPDAREYLAALDSYPQTFEIYDKVHALSTPKEMLNFLDEGRAILRYHNILVGKAVRSAVPGELITPDGKGHPCFAVNSTLKDLVSDIGNRLAHDDFIGFMWGYSHRNNSHSASLRSVGDVDVSAIAGQFGGGGHKNASGMPFEGHIEDVFVPYVGDKAETAQKVLDELIG